MGYPKHPKNCPNFVSELSKFASKFAKVKTLPQLLALTRAQTSQSFLVLSQAKAQ